MDQIPIAIQQKEMYFKTILFHRILPLINGKSKLMF